MDLLTLDELADLLRISRNRIIILVKNGDIPALRVFGKLIFDANEIEHWLKQHRVQKESNA